MGRKSPCILSRNNAHPLRRRAFRLPFAQGVCIIIRFPKFNPQAVNEIKFHSAVGPDSRLLHRSIPQRLVKFRHPVLRAQYYRILYTQWQRVCIITRFQGSHSNFSRFLALGGIRVIISTNVLLDMNEGAISTVKLLLFCVGPPMQNAFLQSLRRIIGRICCRLYL